MPPGLVTRASSRSPATGSARWDSTKPAAASPNTPARNGSRPTSATTAGVRVGGLVPAELDERAEQGQRQLAVPPAGGRYPAQFQGVPIGLDGVLFGLWQPVAVDRQVPGQVHQRRGAAGPLPVQQDGPAAR